MVIYMNLFFGGATSWPEFAVKVFLLYLFSAFVGVCFPRVRQNPYAAMPRVVASRTM
jgi:NADH-quinone oxidoreductase subunit H